jgi:large subunit ribosomal protein L23
MATNTSTHTANVSLLKNPRVTEKAAHASAHNTYLFDVAADATKSEIAKAFETVYKKKPVSVNTVTVRRKSFFRRGKLGFGTAGKKAYVTLPKGVTIDIA